LDTPTNDMSAPDKAPSSTMSLTTLMGSISCGFGLAADNGSDDGSESTLADPHLTEVRLEARAPAAPFSPFSDEGDAAARERAWGGEAPRTPRETNGESIGRALRQLRLFGSSDDVTDDVPPTPGGTRDVVLQVVQRRRTARAARAPAHAAGRPWPPSPPDPSQGYDAAVAVSTRQQATSRLHEWLLSRGLGAHFGALERLGAKRVSDLALLTSDDFDQLGVSAAERELFRIELR